MPLLDSDDGVMESEPVSQRGNHIHISSPNFSHKQDNMTLDTDDGHTTSTTMSQDEESGFSFSLDLGPSILDDVLQVMDKHHN